MKIEKYPIYTIDANWIEDGTSNFLRSTEGLPEGRIRNGTGFRKMFKEKKTQEELDVYVQDWWNKYIELKKASIKNPEIVSLKIQFKEEASWCLHWFSHFTFDVGATDKEYLESFEEFVNDKQALIERAERNGDSYSEGTLMSAEDRWRWRSGSEEYHEIPCRCEDCVKNGVVMIAH